MECILNAIFHDYINDTSTKFIYYITYTQEFNVLSKI